MKNILLSSLVLLLVLCVSTSARAQQTAKQKDFTLPQLIELQQQLSLPSVNDYLLARGWQFSQGDPGEEMDQVVWLYVIKGQNQGAMNVFFCNQCANSYCQRCDLHTNNGQHAVSLTYQANKATFDDIKRAAEGYHMNLQTVLGTRALRTVYTGNLYVLDLSVVTSSGPPKYYVDLRLKTAGDAPSKADE